MNTQHPNREQTANKDPSASTIDPPDHWNPMAPYGEQASLSLLLICIKSIIRRPPSVTVLLLALALTIPGTVAILSSGLIAAENNLLDSRQLTVFLTNKNSSETAALTKTLADNKHITAVELQTIDLHNKEVMTLEVHPATTLDKRQLEFIIDELKTHSLVNHVAADLAWLERNIEAIEIARKLRLASIAAAALMTVLFVYLLTRTDLSRQKSDLSALQQLGASPMMLQKPLMLRSMTLTILASTAGLLPAWVTIASLPHVVDMSIYGELLPESLPVTNVFLLGILAVLCSFLAVKATTKKDIYIYISNV